jgi:tRNA-Thr(GGU) m(6)t(6)A37 methyltransferase TsaA
MLSSITYKPVGIVHSGFKIPEGTPIQPAASNGDSATIEIYPEYLEGLKDLDGFSHIYVIFHLHQITKHPLTVIPFLDTEPRGVFATRSPGRPNPIGISVVKLIKIEGPVIYIQNHDILDGSP